MDPYIFGFFVLAYVALLIWGLWKHGKTASIIIVFVLLALIYDNTILAFGSVIGEGKLLETLSAPRFWLHALFTPLLIIFSYFILVEANIQFAQKTWVAGIFVIGTIAAIFVEYFVELRDLSLKVSEEYGVVSYSSAEAASGPPPMIIMVLVALLVAAIILAWKRKWWWMLVGTVVMGVGSAVPLPIESNAITNLFELLLLISLLVTAIHFSRKWKQNRT